MTFLMFTLCNNVQPLKHIINASHENSNCMSHGNQPNYNDILNDVLVIKTDVQLTVTIE
ncbi:hypothetical protein ACKGJY_09945 [Hyunsoonleella sp. 2307UL5-6]|uniref:hypothetical protein n=1 Tax=Hyunsoonleella sp. 2307UL5-6 TaxID=3384768 RepID=UPI0039BC9340